MKNSDPKVTNEIHVERDMETAWRADLSRVGAFECFLANHKPNMVVNAIFRWASMLVGLLVLFFLTPFVIDKVGKYGFGIWGLLSSLLGYYGLLNLGVTSAFARYVSVSIGKKDLGALNVIFNTAFAFFLVAGAIALTASLLVGPWLAVVFSVDDPEEFSALVRIVGLSVALSFPASALISLVVAHECFRSVSVISIASTLLRTIATVVLLSNGHGVEGVVYAMLITSVFDLCIYLLLVRTRFAWVKIAPRRAQGAVLKKLLVFGLPAMLMMLAAFMRTKLDNVVVGATIGIEQVAVYSIAGLIVTHIFSIANNGLGVMTPRLARSVGANQDVNPILFTGLFFSSFIAWSAATGVYFFGERFIFLWLGEGYHKAVEVLWILMACYVVNIIQIPGYSVLVALNRHHRLAAFTLVEGVVNVGLSIYLANKYGLIGVALGTAIPLLFVQLIVQPYVVTRAVGITMSQYLKPTLIPALVGLGCIGVGYMLNAERIVDVVGWSGFVMAAGGCLGILAVVTLGSAKLVSPKLLSNL